jgi:integrase
MEVAMSRTIQDAKLDTRAARLRLKMRREPYWRTISEGFAIGYRKGNKGGTWIARHYAPENGRRFQAIGTADDIVDADGAHIFSFAQAQAAAQKWFGELALQDGGELKAGAYTVRNAMDDYVRDYKRRGGKAVSALEKTIKVHINPTLGDLSVAKLTSRRIEAWLDEIASAPPRMRTKVGAKQAYRTVEDSPENTRRRRSSANRILTVLKAALNLAHQHHRVANPAAWSLVKPYREVDAPKIRYLNDQETTRLVNACPQDLRMIVIAALLSGARYGEVKALRVSDYNVDSGTLNIARSKSGKARTIFLTDEGREFFSQVTAGKEHGDVIFRRAAGPIWKNSDQSRPLKEACDNAKIIPAISFHVLRHTYASRLVMKGAPLPVIAQQLGHADTRMTERHYAHLAPSYVADTVRAVFTSFGIVEKSNVVSIAA